LLAPKKIVLLLKGYPRLSETFIAQEILGLERAGLEFAIVAMRRPTDSKQHPVHAEIKARVSYLPEYLREEPLRVIRSLALALSLPGFWLALQSFLVDFRRDPTLHRIRRYGQALVLAAEWPEDGEWLHAHFIHTPASVAAYTSQLRGIPWTCSAHAKDIWTSPDWDIARKISAARWVVTCTRAGFTRLAGLTKGRGKLALSYHGLDLLRFDSFPSDRSDRAGFDQHDPVVILSVGRLVEKKGYDVLLRALALLRPDLAWRFIHIGGGDDEAVRLRSLAVSLGIAHRIVWKGAQAQEEILQHYRQADLFALACRVGKDGDRDGLPNVLVEACSQRLACVSTNISGVTELLEDGANGLVVEPEDPEVFSRAMLKLITNPAYRKQLGEVAEKTVRERFDYRSGIKQLLSLFETGWQTAR
jgi:glycosyltransferase involved in cell wall biosynthesis